MEAKDWFAYICAGAALVASLIAVFPNNDQARLRKSFGIAAIVLFVIAGVVGIAIPSKKPDVTPPSLVNGPTSTGVPAPSASATTSDPVDPPLDPVPSSTGPAPTFQLQLGTNTYADLDTGETSTSGGRRYEVRLDILARLFHRNADNDPTNTFLSQYRLVDIDDTDAAGCSHSGQLLNKGFIAASDLRDNNLCVSTSDKHWAILALDDIAGTSIFTVEGAAFNVYLSK